MEGVANTPAANHLLTVSNNENCHKKNLDCSTTLLRSAYINSKKTTKHTTLVSILCNRKKNPDEHVYNKRTVLIQYIRGRKELT